MFNIIECLYADNSGEIASACALLGILRKTGEAGDPQGNGVAERQIQEVKLGSAANLARAGMPHQYWHHAMRHWCCARNAESRGRTDSAADMMTPHQHRFGEPFEAMRVPFGARVQFMPTRVSRHWNQTKPFEPKLIEGIFLGWRMHPGGRWSSLYCIAALADFEELRLLRGLEDCGRIIYPQDVHRVEIPTEWDYLPSTREIHVRKHHSRGTHLG